jgi:hypothetical protein
VGHRLRSIMPPRRTAILRWTGKGSLVDLRSSVEFVLRDRHVRARVRRLGDSVIVEGPEPAGVGALLGHMPGVAWTAFGYTVSSFGELASASGMLARKYLRRGGRFSVDAEVRGGGVASDVAGAVTSAILDSVRGARISNESPSVRFRAALDGPRGVAGVEVSRGDGGVPTGRAAADCLVSGGMHSSVLAWDAVLMGFRVRMIHAKTSEGSLRAVAKLYAELSHRADPRWLRLDVLEGGSPAGLLARFVSESRGPVFAGFSAPGPGIPGKLGRKLLAPLYLTPGESFESQFDGLRLKSFDSRTDWSDTRVLNYSTRSFAGVAADVSGVLDGIR